MTLSHTQIKAEIKPISKTPSTVTMITMIDMHEYWHVTVCCSIIILQVCVNGDAEPMFLYKILTLFSYLDSNLCILRTIQFILNCDQSGVVRG